MCTFFEKQQYQISLFIYAGYFTFRGRVASAFSRMMLPNIAGLIVGSIVLGILIKQNIVKQDISAIELTAIIITNIVYETFLMFLMGYGLIELPRSVWLQGSLSASLLRAQMKACADFSDISEAQTSMGLCVASVIKTRNEVRYKNILLFASRLILSCFVLQSDLQSRSFLLHRTRAFCHLSNLAHYHSFHYYNTIERIFIRQRSETHQRDEHFVSRCVIQ